MKRSARAVSRVPVSGFSLVEVAIVLVIVGLVLLSLMSTLSVQVEQRNFNDTRARLEQARELVLSFAIVNGRLPCPASNAAGTGDEDPVGGGACSANYSGFLPARAIGFQPTDSAGYALDAWGNRIRYAVARNLDGSITSCVDTATTAHFTLASKLRSNGITCKPNDLIVCSVNQPISVGTACGAGTAVTNTATIAAIVFSTGKNGGLGPQGSNENENVDGDHVFVSKTPDPADAATGEFDDMLVWIPVGLLYGRLIAAGQLP